VALGAYITVQGAMGMSLQQVFQGIADGTVRLINGIVTGIQLIGGAIWAGVMWTVTKILELGQAILYWGGVALDALAQIIYFVAFIIIIYCWNWFLVLMKHIARGEIETAFASVKRPMKKLVKKTLRYSRAYQTTEGFLRKRAKRPYGWQVDKMKDYPTYKKRMD
jgi:hypothetical protein